MEGINYLYRRAPIEMVSCSTKIRLFEINSNETRDPMSWRGEGGGCRKIASRAIYLSSDFPIIPDLPPLWLNEAS